MKTNKQTIKNIMNLVQSDYLINSPLTKCRLLGIAQKLSDNKELTENDIETLVLNNII